MSKLRLFPKDLFRHHQSKGEISPKLLQEQHEGLAFSLGKFLVYFDFYFFFFPLVCCSFPLIYLIYLFLPFFFFLSFSILINLCLTKCSQVVKTSHRLLPWCCCRSWSRSAVPAAWQHVCLLPGSCYARSHHTLLKQSKLQWLGSLQCTSAELSWNGLPVKRCFMYLSHPDQVSHFSFWYLLKNVGACLSSASGTTCTSWLLCKDRFCCAIQEQSSWCLYTLTSCGKKQQEHLLIRFVLGVPCSRDHPAWLGRGCSFTRALTFVFQVGVILIYTDATYFSK